MALEQSGDKDAAEDAYREALNLDETLPGSLVGLARILRSRGRYDEAEQMFRKALAVDPKRLTALTGLAELLQHTGRHSAALRLYRRATRVAPANAGAWFALGQALSNAHRDHEALSVFRKLKRAGLGGKPILAGEAIALGNLGRYRACLQRYRQLLDVEPRSVLRSAYLFSLHASVLMSPSSTLRELRQWEKYNGVPTDRRYARWRVKRDPDRPLRIGYISPDFRTHVVRQFFEPVMRVHDPEGFTFFCYAEVERPDHATSALRAVADRWFTTAGVSDEDVAAQIRKDGIDVLVDLAGHTAHHRLGVMSYRPAPGQATYLGYFGSTGLSTIDYWITDGVLHPPDTREPATENIYRLPRCAFCYGVPSHARSRSARVARPGRVTFGCYNNVCKVSLKVVDAWSEILRRCPGSRIALKDRRFQFGRVRRTWLQRFERRGIDRGRVELLSNSPHDQYMLAYNDIDIALDPFPRTGGTTTCDALWMGVPVVSLAGGRYVERLSATKLTAVGVTELIVSSVDEYIDKTVDLARDRDRISEYHHTLRRRMSNSELCDPLSLAQALEDAYRNMWSQYANENRA